MSGEPDTAPTNSAWRRGLTSPDLDLHVDALEYFHSLGPADLETPGDTLTHPTPHSESREPAIVPLRLEVVEGVDRGLQRDYAQLLIRVGTRNDSDLLLHDPTVSRSHLELHGTTAGLLAIDLGSRNGTRVNGV